MGGGNGAGPRIGESALMEVRREVRNMNANALPTINALLIIAGTGTHLNRGC